MSEPKLHFLDCPDPHGQHRMAWWQWGPDDAPHVVVCVHGLSRQGRDFDTLARALLARAAPASLRVICPDIAGRGRSDWLREPTDYQIPNYAADMLRLTAQLRPATLDWVGTSMGGLIGMALCASAALGVRKLVLNDVGPAIQYAAIQRIAQYLGQTMHFDTAEQAADALLRVSAGFGPHTRRQWMALTRPMLKPAPEGGFLLHYDPAIAVPFRAIDEASAARDTERLWQLYDAVRADTLLLRGALSDLLSIETAQAMTRRGPRARLHTFAGIGHAPTLVADEQVRVVADFLLGETAP